jgi:hypothetical protein
MALPVSSRRAVSVKPSIRPSSVDPSYSTASLNAAAMSSRNSARIFCHVAASVSWQPITSASFFSSHKSFDYFFRI